MIETENLSKIFYTGHALDHIDLNIGTGEVHGLIGPNGAGKTTLLRILATVLRATSGVVRIAGHSLPHDTLAVRRVIGYMPDSFGTYEELRVDGYLEFFAHVYGLPRDKVSGIIGDVLELVDLTSLGFAPIASLSLGVRQRLALARVLLHNPQVLLLDEPVTGLDPRARVEMRVLLRELANMGKTILISSHVLTDLADLCDRLFIMERGREVFSGSLDDLKRRVAGPRRVEVAVADREEEAVAHLRRQTWTLEAHRNNGTIDVLLQDTGVPIADVSASLSGAGFAITRFLEREIDLEEAFLRLTRGEIT